MISNEIFSYTFSIALLIYLSSYCSHEISLLFESKPHKSPSMLSNVPIRASDAIIICVDNIHASPKLAYV